MKIDTPILWQFQHLFRQNLSVCQNDNEIRIQLAQGLQRRCGIFALSQRQGLIYRNVIFQRRRLDCGGDGMVTTSLGTVGLGQNAHNLVLALCQIPQCRHGNIRRSHINDSHASSKSSGSTNSSTTSMNS